MNKKKKISVVVLGDIGRSPRMQYHALSAAEEGFSVTVIGYGGSDPLPKLATHPDVKIYYMVACPEFKQYVATVVAYFLKVLWQSITLFFALLLTQFPDHVLVQNCPSIPTLGVCYIYSKLCRSKLIIDWHNYGHSLLALSLKPDHILVKICKWFEFYFGASSNKNICVTEAMKNDLLEQHNIKSVVFYDRAPETFRKITVHEKHRTLLRLGIEYAEFLKGCGNNETILTQDIDGDIVLKNKRPGILVSSTSWTEDEDFSVLLDALEEYEKAAVENELPDLLCAITGKGPLKKFYLGILNKKDWKHVTVLTPWLSPDDYPLLLACADLGVSLHTSSSGLDLPMKVVDMFGCEVPVCAIKFNCISELVKHNENGFVFTNTQVLFQQLKSWFSNFNNQTYYSTIRQNIAKNAASKWHDNWKTVVLPLLNE